MKIRSGSQKYGKPSESSHVNLCKFSGNQDNGALAISFTVKILNIGTPEIITIIILQLEQLDFTVQHGVQKMQTE